MKKTLVALFLLISFVSFGQYPNGIQTLGNDSNLVMAKGGLKGRLIVYPYADTVAANLERIRQYPGAMIYTTSDGFMWLRNPTATGWVKIGGGTVPGGSFFSVGGNLWPITTPTRNLGSLAPYGGAIGFMTNGIVRFILPNDGLLPMSAGDDSLLVINTSGELGKVAKSAGGGTVTSFSAGNLSPLFTSSVANSTTTPALTFALSNTTARTVFGRATGTGVPSFVGLDTNYIANFSTMVRPLFSAGTGITYDNVTGVFTATGSGGGTDTAYGNFFNSTFPGSSLPSDLTSVTANTTTVSSGLNIRSNGTSGFKTNYLSGTEYTASANYTITTRFRVDTLPCTTCPGLTVGRISINNPFFLDMGVALRNVNGSTGRLVLYMTNNSIAFNPLDSTAAVALAAGNWYRVTIMASVSNIQYKIALLDSTESQYQDETDFQESKYDLQYNTLPVNTPGIVTNTSRVWISNPGGAYTMSLYNEYHYDLLNSSVVVVGTSISTRNYTNVLQNHYVVKAFTNAPQVKYTILAGGGDKLAEFRLRFPELKTIRPQYVVIEGFANDNQASVTTNLRPYLDSIITNGMTPIVFQTVTGANIDTAISNACIDKNVELINVIKYMTGGMFIDGTHPTDEGNIFMAKFLRNEAPEIFNFTGKVDDNVAFAFQRVLGSTNTDIYTPSTNAGFGGTIAPQVAVDIGTNGSFRAQGFQSPTTGSGVEVGFFSTYGYAFSRNATAGTFTDFKVGNQTTEQLILYGTGAVTINEAGADADIRIESDGDANNLFSDGGANRIGIGTGTPSAKAHILATTEQLRIGYDAGNYFSTTVGSGGEVTFDAVGEGASFAFSGKTIEGYTAKYNLQTGTSYTLVAADAGRIISCSNGSDITLTVPAGLPTGFTCTFVQLGAGEIVFTASSTTISNRQSFTKTAGQYAVASITMYSANNFITGGDLQ